MILKYKTENLPLNFIFLGIMLLGVSIWRIIVLDPLGFLFLLMALLCLFINSGVIIDTQNLRIKNYTGIFFIKPGKWRNIDTYKGLQIIKESSVQRMHVLSISRAEQRDIYKIQFILKDKLIDVMSGNKKCITQAAKDISSALQQH